MAAPVATTGDLISAADWNAGPLGKLDLVTRTTNFNNLGPSYADCGLTISALDVGTSRRIRVSAQVLLEADVTACRGDARILIDAGQVHQASTQLAVGSTGRGSIFLQIDQDLSGSTDFKVQIGRSGSDTVDLVATSTAVAWLRVEDVGPS